MRSAKSARVAGQRRRSGKPDYRPSPITDTNGKPVLTQADKAAIGVYLRHKRLQAQAALDTIQDTPLCERSGGHEGSILYWRHALSCIRWLDAGLQRTGGRHRAN